MSRDTRLLGPTAFLAATALGLAACGGGGSGSDMGQMKLAVADAPIDGAQAVVVKFTGIELTGDGGSPVDITFAQPKSIDLLTQSGTASAVLFDQPIPAGSYGQIRLMVMADGDPSNSYITLSDGTLHGLQVPSGSETGLKLVSGFTVPSSGVVDYTIDFDLRQAITCPPGQSPACILKPVERLVDNTTVGNIQGAVSNTLIPNGCTPGVYLYNGAVTAPEDMNGAAAATDTNQPLASKVPVADSQRPSIISSRFYLRARTPWPSRARPHRTFLIKPTRASLLTRSKPESWSAPHRQPQWIFREASCRHPCEVADTGRSLILDPKGELAARRLRS